MQFDSLYLFISVSIILIILVGMAVLIPMAVVRQDYGIMVKNPLMFLFETLLIGVVPALPFLFFMVSRGISSAAAYALFISFAVKFAAIHILFQISGFYSYSFEE